MRPKTRCLLVRYAYMKVAYIEVLLSTEIERRTCKQPIQPSKGRVVPRDGLHLLEVWESGVVWDNEERRGRQAWLLHTRSQVGAKVWGFWSSELWEVNQRLTLCEELWISERILDNMYCQFRILILWIYLCIRWSQGRWPATSLFPKMPSYLPPHL